MGSVGISDAMRRSRIRWTEFDIVRKDERGANKNN